MEYNTDMLVSEAKEIWRIISNEAGPKMLASWGALKYDKDGNLVPTEDIQLRISKNRPAVIFMVDGLLHQGGVVVTHCLDFDDYKIQMLNSDGKAIRTAKNVSRSNLVRRLDEMIEHPSGISSEDYRLLRERDMCLKYYIESLQDEVSYQHHVRRRLYR